MRQNGKRGRERLSPVKIVLVLLLVAAVYAVVLLGIEFIGHRIEKPRQAETYGNMDGRFEDALKMEFQGDTYQYRRNDFINILLMGVDRDNVEADRNTSRGGGQADFLLLLSIDRENKSIIPIQIDRDTMTEVQVYGVFGNPAGSREMQICLAYAFGASPEVSCENTVRAVSDLMGGIPIDYYMAMDLSGISVLNDALGGITVILEDDFSDMDPAMVPGVTLKLQGVQAEHFLRGRMTVGDGTNASRMRRQRVYLDAALEIFEQNVLQDGGYADWLLDELEDHLHTNMKRSWMTNQLLSREGYERNAILVPEGEHSVGPDGFMEHDLDDVALAEMLINIYFKQV